MSTRLIDEIEKIAAEATLESTAQDDTLPSRPAAPPTRPAALEPLQTKKRKKKRKQPGEIPLERRAPLSPRPVLIADEAEKIQETEINETLIDNTPKTIQNTGIENGVYVNDENNNELVEAEEAEHILGVYIHRTDHITFSMRRILVKVNIMNGLTNTLLEKQNETNKSVSYYETERQIPVKYIMPIMSQPFQVDKQHSLLPQWEELLQFNESYKFITDQRNAAYFIFQVQDCIPGDQRKTVAWAYLRCINHVTNELNLNKRLRLQLFSPPKPAQSDELELSQIVSLISQTRKQKLSSTLHVTISSLLPFSKRPVEQQTIRSMRPDQKEIGRAEIIEVEGVPSLPLTSPTTDSSQLTNDVDWKRAAGTPCRLPNAIHDRSQLIDETTSSREFGGFCCSFSPCGTFIAWTSAQQYEHKIIVERFLGNPNGRKTRVPIAAHSGLIYDLHWSEDSSLLAACSADQTATIWLIPNNLELNSVELVATLPAPCYLYGCRINKTNDQIYLVGQEGSCYIYTKIESNFELINEISITESALNSIAISADHSTLYCCSSTGFLHWATFSQLANEASEFESKRLSQSSADCVATHPKIAQKLAVLCRDNSIHYIDMRLGDVIRLEGVVSMRQLTRCAFSPCGSLLFAACESGAIVCYGTVKRERLGQLNPSQLGHSSPCRDVTYHPSYHALCAIAYQPGAMIQIWRHDFTLAKAAQRPRVQVKPTEEKINRESLPPLPSPMLSSNNLNRIKTQFDTALDRMKLLNESKTSLDRQLQSKTVSRNLFPSGERGDFQAMKPELSDQSLNETMNQSNKPERNTSVRYTVEQQMKRLKKYESQIRQLSPAKPPEPEIVRPRLEEQENVDVNQNAETKETENIQETSKPDEITHHVITETKPKKKKRRKKPRAELPPLPPPLVKADVTIESTDERLPDTSTASANMSVMEQLRSIATSQ